MRPITYSALFVDGVLADENLEPPFDQFTRNLEGFTADGTYQLQVQARDAMGLEGASVQIPVNLTVEMPPASR